MMNKIIAALFSLLLFTGLAQAQPPLVGRSTYTPAVPASGGGTITAPTASPLVMFKNSTTGAVTNLSYPDNNSELYFQSNTAGLNTIGVENLSQDGFSAVAFRQGDQSYTFGGLSYEHMAVGYGPKLSLQGQLGYGYGELSRFTGTSDPTYPPSRYVLQQTGGACKNTTYDINSVLTSGLATITKNGGGNFPADINGMQVYWGGYVGLAYVSPGTTVLSGQGTATLTLSTNSLLSNGFVHLQFCAPVYGQYTYMIAQETGPVDWFTWTNGAPGGSLAPYMRFDRNNGRLGVGAYSLGLQPSMTFDAIGQGVFGSSTTSRDGTFANGALNIVDAGTRMFEILKVGVNTFRLTWNASPSRLDFVDVNASKTPLSIYMDGTATTVHAGPTFYTGVVKTTPTTGGTVIYATTQRTALIVPAGTLATLTLTLPACAAANDGDERDAIFSQTITTLTVGASAGSVVGASSSATVGGGHAYHCYGADTTWYQKY